jgi:Holliday junction resolvasome RuvABC DNA-binding subunit
MMSIDKNVHSEELKLSHIFAIKFGYKRDQITELVETIQSNIEHGQGHEETMKRAIRLIS